MSTIEQVNENSKTDIILALDISIACIGISIVKDDGKSDPEILKITHVVPKIKKNIKGIEALILRKEIFENEFLSKYKNFGITECIIESPLAFATGNSNVETVSQLLQFNGLLSESVYRVLGIIPNYISSYNARLYSFPQLLSIRKLNKKGDLYPLNHYKKALKNNDLVLFGSFPFDCDKKSVMMDLVSEKYPSIEWITDKKGGIKKENYDACDSLVCALAYINKKRYGDINPIITKSEICNLENSKLIEISYTIEYWDKKDNRILNISIN